MTNVPRTIVARINKAIEGDNESDLIQILQPERRGRKTVLSKEEEDIIVKEIKRAASLGFTIENDDIRMIMARIANNGRKRGWKNEIPSDDAIRSFGARRTDITY